MALLLVTYIGSAIAESETHCDDYDTIKGYAKCEVTQRFGSSEWESFEWIVEKESRWIDTAQNPYSSAFGLCQFLTMTWDRYGEKTTDPKLQIQYCFDYLEDRYDTPTKAKNFHIKKGYY